MVSSDDSPLFGQSGDESIDTDDTSGAGLVTKPWNPQDIRITTKSLSIRELFFQMTEMEVDLAPDFQRSFVWDAEQQTRLVESILLGIPLPALYLNQDNSGLHQVIDGVQRLTTIKKFMSNQLELDADGLEYLGTLAGQRYETLDRITQRRFANTLIVAHVIEPQTPDEVKYDIFNRVNTGGTPLAAQEIRHCMSKPRSRDFLKRMVNSDIFNKATSNFFFKKNAEGNLIRNDKRMKDRELVLRFCAFYVEPLEVYAHASSLDTFLLEFTRRLDSQSNDSLINVDLVQLEAAFYRAMENCHILLGKDAFRRLLADGKRRSPFNRALFESQALALADYHLDQLLPHAEEIRDAFRRLFDDEEYEDAVRFGTGSPAKVDIRLTRTREAVQGILLC